MWAGEEPREMRVGGGSDLMRARLHTGHTVRIVSPSGGEAEEEGAILRLVLDPEQEEPDPLELWFYAVQVGEETREIAESFLEPLAGSPAEPLEGLQALAWRGSRSFSARLDLLRSRSLWYENAFGIPAFLGARIVPLPHQIHAARRVLTDRVPRFVLADEVGLGKTIEAGLILQALAAANADLRVLVIAPGAMSRQWLCELFLRFGEQVFVHIDAPRLEDPDAEDLLAAPRLIISTAALESAPIVQDQLLEHRWDVVVIDEAHQVHPDSPLYGFLRRMAKHAWGLLALSATPAKGDVRGLLGLLGLVAPEAYDPAKPEGFAEALEAREAVAGQLDTTLRELETITADGGKPELSWAKKHAKALAAVLTDDDHVASFVKRINSGEQVMEELLSYVQEFHRLDRRIIRTRRATVRALGTALCQRELEVVKYKPSPAEIALVEHVEAVPEGPPGDRRAAVLRGLYRRRACSAPLPLLALLERRRAALAGGAAGDDGFDPLAALGADPGPAEEEYLLERVLNETPALPGEEAWLKQAVLLTHAWMEASSPGGCGRTRAAIDRIKKARGKVLVFAQERETVEAFGESMRDILGPDAVAVSHHGLEEGQLSEVALRFQQQGGPCKVLISDELGGEGRNFQVAKAVLHLDQPWAVGRLEQRIGRLDRIGRRATEPVRSIVMRGPSASEQGLLKLHSEVLGVYERSLGGLEFLLPQVQRSVTEAVCGGGGPALEAIAGPLQDQVSSERARAEEAYERALDASTRRLEEATEMSEVLESIDGADDAPSLGSWAKRIGMKIKPLGDALYSIEWTWEHLRRVPPGMNPPRISIEGRVRKRGTFSRERALKDESLELFSPGHPLVDAIVRDLDTVHDGRCSAFTRNLGPTGIGRAFLLVAARTSLPDAELPAGLRYRAQAYLWPQIRTAAVELAPGKPVDTRVVADRKLLAALETRDSSDRTLDADDLARTVDLPSLWKTVRKAADEALVAIKEGRQAEVDDAAQQLQADLVDDQAFLRGLADRTTGDERAAAEAELGARDRLLTAVGNEQITLESVALIIGVAGN